MTAAQPAEHLVRRLVEQVRAAGTARRDGPSHLAIKSSTESLGICNQSQPKHGACTPTCQAWRQVIADAQRWLDACESERPPSLVQAPLLEEVPG